MVLNDSWQNYKSPGNGFVFDYKIYATWRHHINNINERNQRGLDPRLTRFGHWSIGGMATPLIMKGRGNDSLASFPVERFHVTAPTVAEYLHDPFHTLKTPVATRKGN